MRITEDIYCYEWNNPFENNCNSYFIAGTVGALIDPGLTAHVTDLIDRLNQDGVVRKDIRYIINTHAHPDHFQGSEFFSADENVIIGLNDKETLYLEKYGKDMFDLFGLAFPEVEIGLVLKEGKMILGKETFEIHHVPGHSPGSIGLYWPERKALFSGDVIFNGNIGRTDFPGGSSPLLKKSIRRLSSLDTHYLLPGHMRIIEGKDRVTSNFLNVERNILPYI